MPKTNCPSNQTSWAHGITELECLHLLQTARGLWDLGDFEILGTLGLEDLGKYSGLSIGVYLLATY